MLLPIHHLIGLLKLVLSRHMLLLLLLLLLLSVLLLWRLVGIFWINNIRFGYYWKHLRGHEHMIIILRLIGLIKLLMLELLLKWIMKIIIVSKHLWKIERIRKILLRSRILNIDRHSTAWGRKLIYLILLCLHHHCKEIHLILIHIIWKEWMNYLIIFRIWI